MLSLDISGDRYGRLTATKRLPNDGRKTIWLFACDCGAAVSARLDHVRRGRIVSCGCWRDEKLKERSTTHGNTLNRVRTREYRAWCHAKDRCENPNTERYPSYGGRGIRVCDRWRSDFAAFLTDMGECPEGMSLDRIDPNGDYESSNCRWATNHQQSRNRTDNIFVSHEGQRMVLKDYASVRGVDYKKLASMVSKGDDPAVAAEALSR